MPNDITTPHTKGNTGEQTAVPQGHAPQGIKQVSQVDSFARKIRKIIGGRKFSYEGSYSFDCKDIIITSTIYTTEIERLIAKGYLPFFNGKGLRVNEK